MARVLVCLDEVPDPAGECTAMEWQEAPTILPPLSIEDAQAISFSALLAWATVGAALLIRKAT